MKRKKKQTTPRELLLLLAAKWVKDTRTISEWFRRNDPMLTHHETVEVMEKYYGDKNRKAVQKNKDRKEKYKLQRA